MNTQLTELSNKLAKTFDLGSGQGLIETLKKTAFKGEVTNEQMTALLIVANQYKLNPWTSEIYAFPSNGGITPVVGVDGWARIINANSQFDGMDFEYNENSCTCRIYRKDRAHPVSVTEFMSECRRNTQPWKTHPNRMLRHKAMIQAARLAFGFAGIYDEDEAERIKNAKDCVGEDEPNPFAGDLHNPERQNLITEAEQVAQKGDIDLLREHFRSLSTEQRAIIGTDEMVRISNIAKDVELNTVDAEIKEA
ncbi:phage recombination protein Bet [Snodgrassella sp. B3088]|uniref:phage recombination protein Bet n=1 Tax=Snodgrassella sp. B3088 TaxID=2818038 RepID=UPI00226A25E4|nr:phage recombination protein Bet [Snodgrassella sp. B3088]